MGTQGERAPRLVTAQAEDTTCEGWPGGSWPAALLQQGCEVRAWNRAAKDKESPRRRSLTLLSRRGLHWTTVLGLFLPGTATMVWAPPLTSPETPAEPRPRGAVSELP